MVDGEDEGEPYDWESETPEECRARMLAIFVVGCFGCLIGGMGLGFALDWLQRTVL